MRRGSASYGAFSHGGDERSARRPRSPWARAFLRTAILGPLGWAALIGACLVAGALGAVVVARAGRPAAFGALAGACAVILALVVADRRKWGRMTTTYSCEGSPELAAALNEGFAARGVAAQASYDVEPTPDWPVSAGWGHDVVNDRPLLRVSFRHGDTRVVDAVLSAHGVRLPWRP